MDVWQLRTGVRTVQVHIWREGSIVGLGLVHGECSRQRALCVLVCEQWLGLGCVSCCHVAWCVYVGRLRWQSGAATHTALATVHSDLIYWRPYADNVMSSNAAVTGWCRG